MASLRKIVEQLELTNRELDEAKVAADAAISKADEFITQVMGMDLQDAAAELEKLKVGIEATRDQIEVLVGLVDDVKDATEAIGSQGEAPEVSTTASSEPRVSPGTSPATSTPAAQPTTASTAPWVAPGSFPDDSTPTFYPTAASSTPWVAPGSSDTTGDYSRPWVPKKESTLGFDSRVSEAKIKNFPGWRKKITSKRSATAAIIVVGGTSAAVSQIVDIPSAVGSIVTTFLTVVAVWENHKANEEEDEKEESDDA